MTTPSLSVLVKLASIAVHADEMLSSQGHYFDAETIRSLVTDPEVEAYLIELRALALLPVKRDAASLPSGRQP